MATLPPCPLDARLRISPTHDLSHVRKWINQLEASLCGQSPQQRLPYEALLRYTFDWLLPPERAGELLSIVVRYAKTQIKDHPLLYEDEAALWELLPNEPRQLTGAGVLVTVEAWCQDSHHRPAQYSADEHTTLRFWRCHAAHIIRQVFASSVSSLPAQLVGDQASMQLQLRMSTQHFRDCFRSYVPDHAPRLSDYHRQRYAPRFRRIQAYGLQPAVPGGQPTVFFLPATEILTHMQHYFASNEMFAERNWRSPTRYVHYAQFTNIMLLNLCGEVMRQITTVLRIHEAADSTSATTPLLPKVDETNELHTSQHVRTLTESILLNQQAGPTARGTRINSNLHPMNLSQAGFTQARPTQSTAVTATTTPSVPTVISMTYKRTSGLHSGVSEPGHTLPADELEFNYKPEKLRRIQSSSGAQIQSTATACEGGPGSSSGRASGELLQYASIDVNAHNSTQECRGDSEMNAPVDPTKS
jgi:hypothetical protein